MNSLTRSRWEQAISRLEPEDKEGTDLNSGIQDPNPLAILRGFVQQTEKKKEEFHERQWKYKDASGQEVLVRDRMNTLLVNLNKYTAVADLVVQPLPSVVSLAWGGCKILLQACLLFSPSQKVHSNSPCLGCNYRYGKYRYCDGELGFSRPDVGTLRYLRETLRPEST